MEPKIILAIIMFLGFSYFIFGNGSRLLKKKSHHYIDPPASKKDPNWVPINIDEYENLLFFKKSKKVESSDIKKVIYEEFTNVDLEIELINNWFKIKIVKSNFTDFHHLISFCTFFGDKSVLGFCKHLSSESKDYIVKLNTESDGQHLVGAFRNNQNFGVYLPKAHLDPKGNMSSSSVKEIDYNTEFNKIITLF